MPPYGGKNEEGVFIGLGRGSENAPASFSLPEKARKINGV